MPTILWDLWKEGRIMRCELVADPPRGFQVWFATTERPFGRRYPATKKLALDEAEAHKRAVPDEGWDGRSPIPG